MFNNSYKDKRILITGHTGFKGSWLTAWLIKLGANVVGFSDRVPTEPSLFKSANLARHIDNRSGNICNLEELVNLINNVKPDFVFHLAAQSIVSVSYEFPINTITTNVLGTANMLEALRLLNHPCSVVIITSDKCYENTESFWGYKETDHLGGKDIYSGSKGAAEVIFHSYFHSFFQKDDCLVRVATGRAGNVIGGGDWAKDRIVVDCMKNWSENRCVEIRNPNATRPWQHVLEPLSGYLALGSDLSMSHESVGESFNFGPRSEQNRSVLELISDLSEAWHFKEPEHAYRVTGDTSFNEASLLKLNCDKALHLLKWQSNCDYIECINLVSEWYYNYYRLNTNIFKMTFNQIERYEAKATKKRLPWAC